jgi:hypothetical protein
MSTVDLTQEQLENVRREVMGACVKSLEIAASELRRLAEIGPWGDDTIVLASDAMGAVHIARMDLDTLAALGWPANVRGD